MNFLIESSRSHGSRVKRFFVVGRTDHKDLICLLKAVHFRKDLVNSCTGRGVLRLEAARFTEQGIDLIDENDTRLIVSCLLKQLSDSLCTDTDEHLIEMRSSAINEACA